MDLKTKVVHAGANFDPLTGAISTPIYQTSTYVQKSPGIPYGHEYSRVSNPTRTALEKCLAELEGGKHCVTTASGLSSTDLVFRALEGGGVLCAKDVYAGTLRLLREKASSHNLLATIDTTDLEQLEQQLQLHRPRLLWLETPSNPLVLLSDIAAIAALCQKTSTLLAVDNTFATPYLQNPLSKGADIVVHSTTKYIGGHSDTLGGAVVVNSDELYEKVVYLQKTFGPTPSAFDSWLLLRGVRTLAVRVEAAQANAIKVANYLAEHTKVEKVYYPGLEDHPQHALAKRQMRGYGAMLSFIPHCSEEQARVIASSTNVFQLAESLGAVESLVSFPHKMTGAAASNVSLNTLRLSIGIEDSNDLICDLEQALGKV